MTRPHLLSLSLAFACCAALCPSPAHAQSEDGGTPGEALEVTQARKHFSQGLRLYKEGDFDAALVQFERAYAVKPNFKVLYNIAQCYFELRQYVETRDTLTRYLREGGDAIDPERRAQVETDLQDLQKRVAHLRLIVNVQGAAVYVDGKKVGTTPLANRIDVSEGQRTIVIESAERGSKQRLIRLAGGEEQTIEIKFDEAARAGAPQPQPQASGAPAPSSESRGLGAGFWITGATALALGAGAGVTGYLTLQAEDKHKEKLDTPNIGQSALEDSRDETKKLALTTDILAGGAVLFAGIATVLFITHDSSPQQVGLGVGPGSLALHGKF